MGFWHLLARLKLANNVGLTQRPQASWSSAHSQGSVSVTTSLNGWSKKFGGGLIDYLQVIGNT
jgi:hypothetical protein